MADTQARIYARDIQLTNAQLKALRATPIELVAAPDNGKALLVEWWLLLKETSSGAYTLGGGTNRLVLAYSSGTSIYTIRTGTDLALDAATRSLKCSSTILDVITVRSGEALQLRHDANAELTGGHDDNTLSLRVFYSIVPTDPFRSGASQD